MYVCVYVRINYARTYVYTKVHIIVAYVRICSIFTYAYACMHNILGASGRISDDDIVLSLVAKQIMIHRLPQALIIHFKRFNIGTYSVTKNSNHVSFSQILNMAPYCSNECLEVSIYIWH